MSHKHRQNVRTDLGVNRNADTLSLQRNSFFPKQLMSSLFLDANWPPPLRSNSAVPSSGGIRSRLSQT